MPRASNLFPERDTTFEFAGETVSITYTKKRDTPAFLKEIEELGSAEEWANYVSVVVTEWDVEDDDGKMWPLDVDSLMELGVDLLRATGLAVMEDAVGKKGSRSGSARKGSTGRNRTGTRGSAGPEA